MLVPCHSSRPLPASPLRALVAVGRETRASSSRPRDGKRNLLDGVELGPIRRRACRRAFVTQRLGAAILQELRLD